MAQTAEQKRAYLAAWRAANKQRIYEYNKAYIEANREEHDAKRAAYRVANAEEIRADAKARYWADTDTAKKRAAGYRLANSEKVRQASRDWRANNPDKQKTATDAWRKANPDANVFHVAKRRARKAAALGRVSRGIVKKLLTDQRGLCAYCSCDLKDGYHMDHKQPLSRGGKHEDANLHLTCVSCNLRKHSKTHEEFLECLR